jgi:hypothetical protein
MASNCLLGRYLQKERVIARCTFALHLDQFSTQFNNMPAIFYGPLKIVHKYKTMEYSGGTIFNAPATISGLPACCLSRIVNVDNAYDPLFTLENWDLRIQDWDNCRNPVPPKHRSVPC